MADGGGTRRGVNVNNTFSELLDPLVVLHCGRIRLFWTKKAERDEVGVRNNQRGFQRDEVKGGGDCSKLPCGRERRSVAPMQGTPGV